MKKYISSLILIFALVGGLMAGTPLSSGKSNGMSAMSCCKKKKNNCNGAASMSAARLCCALHCNNSVPTPSGTSFNFSPSAILISETIPAFEGFQTKQENLLEAISKSIERKAFSRKFQPKYLKHHSFLI